MGHKGSRGRSLRRAFAASLGSLLAIGLAATPAFALVPDAPAPPTAAPGNGQVTVTFAAPGSDGGSPITSYTASCFSFNGGVPGTVTNGGLVAPIVVPGLTNGATYVCTVHATNGDGTGGESGFSNAAIPATVPSVPAAPAATEGNAQISVAFVAPANGGSPIIGYRARCSDGVGTPGINGGTTSPIVVSPLTNGATYTCTIEALNAVGSSSESSASNSVIVGTPDPPAAPIVTAGNLQINVAFALPANNGSTITALRASCTSATGAPGTNTGTVSPIVVTGLTNGAVYTCTADATNANGTGLESAASAPTTPNPTAPDAPVQPTVTPGNAQIIVTFVAPGNNGNAITGYSATCTDGVTPKTVNGTVSPITVTGLTNGHIYTCTVNATNAVGTSGPSPASLPVTPAIAPPNAPAQPIVARGDTQIVVNFIPPADNGSPITGYTVTCTDGVTPKSVPATSSPVTITGLTNGVSYTCVVTATSAAGTSAPSPPSLPVIPAPVPNAPPRPTVTPHSGSIVVAFTAPVDNGIPVTGYSAACISANGGAPAAANGPASPITVTGLTNAKTYTCTVSAVSANGPSSPSLPSLAVVPATVPAAPTLNAAISGNAAITVTFTPNSNNGRAITSFKVACTSANGGVPGLKTGPSSPITLTGLTNGRIYTCKVRASNAVGASGASATSTAVVVGTPAPPTISHVVSGIALGSTAGLNVTFNPGDDGGSAVSSYRATCNPVGSGVARVSTRFTSPVQVLGLLTGHAYKCSVVATNSRGTSAVSNVVGATVGTPAVPAVRPVLKIAGGIVVPFQPPSNNGRAIINYRAQCTSTNGGAPSNPLQLQSPIVVNDLTAGRTYTCLVAAINARGAGAPAKVGPIVVSATQPTELADCRGAGSLVASPGLQLDLAQAHTFALNANLGACIGPYVQQAKVSFSFRTSRAISCDTAIAVANSGSGTISWTQPFGLGTSSGSMTLTIDATDGHTTSASYHGTITSRANLFTNAHVSGTLTLNRGIEGADIGGDCPSSGRIATFAVTAITMSIS